MPGPGRILLISTYELGHQPLGLAWPAAFLARAGLDADVQDLSLEPLDGARVARASWVGISVPMHTALRIGVAVGRRVRELNPQARIVFFGLYAGLNADYLLSEGDADAVLGGEYEAALVELVAGSEPGTRGRGASRSAGPEHLKRLDFPMPLRTGLPDLRRYVHLERDGEQVPAGYVEASRGCLHHCRHCPIPPVYGGRFFVVPETVVLADVAQQVAAGARHVTFGDPDFLNGPRHVMRLVRAMNREFPDLTFDVTTKVSNIVKHRVLFAELAELGCVFVVSAVESLSDRVLAVLNKGHTRADIDRARGILHAAGIPLRPTFVAFTPWTTAGDYLELLDFIVAEDLCQHVDPVQVGLRLLVPPGSLLLDSPELRPHLGALDPAAFTYRWIHPDPRMVELETAVADLVQRAARRHDEAMDTFAAVRALATRILEGRDAPVPEFPRSRARPRPPRLTEDWFC